MSDRGGGLAEAVERGDLDELVRAIDGLCASRDWDGLVELRDRCRRALERGRQLWPAAHLAEYRLALDAPGEWAGAVLEEGAGRFALGPLPEVAASTHHWAELAPNAPAGPMAALCAHECVVRGEDLTDWDVEPPVLDLPLCLESWEPEYALAVYHDDRADFPRPECPAPNEPIVIPSRAEHIERLDDRPACRALVELARTWTTDSNGNAVADAVRGDAATAIAALGTRDALVAAITPGQALALMAWTAASGGAHGRRRGAAPGRFDAWTAAGTLTGLAEAWPLPPDELGDAIATLTWCVWDDVTARRSGWSLRLAAEDASSGRAWALAATDHR